MDAKEAYQLATVIEDAIAFATGNEVLAEVVEVRHILIHTPDGYTAIEDEDDWKKKRDAVFAQYAVKS